MWVKQAICSMTYLAPHALEIAKISCLPIEDIIERICASTHDLPVVFSSVVDLVETGLSLSTSRTDYQWPELLLILCSLFVCFPWFLFPSSLLRFSLVWPESGVLPSDLTWTFFFQPKFSLRCWDRHWGYMSVARWWLPAVEVEFEDRVIFLH